MQYLFFLKEIMYSYLSIFSIGFAGEMTRSNIAETVGTGDPPNQDPAVAALVPCVGSPCLQPNADPGKARCAW